jgi:hypothetical protein
MIRIKSKRANFRRCGVAHPATWTEYPDDRFTAKELKRLKADPMLTVVIVQGEVREKDDAPPTETSPKTVKKGKK